MILSLSYNDQLKKLGATYHERCQYPSIPLPRQRSLTVMPVSLITKCPPLSSTILTVMPTMTDQVQLGNEHSTTREVKRNQAGFEQKAANTAQVEAPMS